MSEIKVKRRDLLLGLGAMAGTIAANQMLIQPVSAKTRLSGAGASFPAPLYQRWFVDYANQNSDVFVNYQSVGSGSGVRQFIAGTVDFGASDVAMKDSEIEKAKKSTRKGVVLLPMTAGSVVVAYNMPGVQLRLDRQQFVDVFLGKITNWRDLGGPNQNITIVHRSDGSGTTAVFTEHLKAISQEWDTKVGAGKTVAWPVGLGGRGNEGVTATIKQTRGAIGYVEFGFAKNNGLDTAILENKNGDFVEATFENASKSLAQVELPENLRAFVVDPVGENSYPIVTYTWILAYDKYRGKKAEALKSVLKWCLNQGQQYTKELGYIPLPSNVVTRVENEMNKISST